MNTVVDWGLHVLHESWFGCASGEQVFWLNLECDSENEARGVLPPSMRGMARIVEVQRLTHDEIRELHS